MQQNTPEWLALRKNKIGASDANIIMGVSKFMTPLDLYLVKKDLPPRRKINDNSFITDKGQWLESKMRAEIELETGCDFPPEIFIHAQIDYLMASMDGFNQKWKMGIEGKYVGQDAFILVQNWDGRFETFPLPEYYPQIQTQYVCSGALKIALVAITEAVEMENGLPKRDEKGNLIYILNNWGKRTYKKTMKVVPVNLEYINNILLPKLIDFQLSYIEKNIEPPPTDADIIEIKDAEIGKKINEYKVNEEKIALLKTKLKPFEVVKKDLSKNIFESLQFSKMRYKNALLTSYSITGKINYESAFNDLKTKIENISNQLSNILNLNAVLDLNQLKMAIDNAVKINLDDFKSENSVGHKITFEKPKKEKEIKGKIITDEDGRFPIPPNTDISSIKIETQKIDELIRENEPAIDGIKPVNEATKPPFETPEFQKNQGKSTPTEIFEKPELEPIVITNHSFNKKLTPTEKRVLKKATNENTLDEWKKMSTEQQRIQGKLNSFKLGNNKSPHGWQVKNRLQRIDYLKKCLKKKDMAGKVNEISELIKEVKTVFNI